MIKKKVHILCLFIVLLSLVGMWLFLQSDTFYLIKVKMNSIYSTFKYSDELSIVKLSLKSIRNNDLSKSSKYFYDDFYFKERRYFLPCFYKWLKRSDLSDLKMLNFESKDLNQEFNTAIYLDNDPRKIIILFYKIKSEKWAIYRISVSDNLGHELQDLCEKKGAEE